MNDEFGKLYKTEQYYSFYGKTEIPKKYQLTGIRLFLWKIKMWWLFHKPYKKQDLDSDYWKMRHREEKI